MVSELIENSEEATSLRDEPLFFRRGVWEEWEILKKNCLQGLKRQNKLFAEKSGKILENIITKTKIKRNKVTNWSISMKINTIWALKSGHSVSSDN